MVEWPPEAFAPSAVGWIARQLVRFARRVWQFVRIARLPGGGESRDIWKLGPLCIKRWSPRVPPAEVGQRCRVSRAVPVCNSMWYIPWLHWTLARWVDGQPATHAACNAVLAAHPVLRDLHPGNVLTMSRGAAVVDFYLTPQISRLCRGGVGPGVLADGSGPGQNDFFDDRLPTAES